MLPARLLLITISACGVALFAAYVHLYGMLDQLLLETPPVTRTFEYIVGKCAKDC